MPAGGTRAPWAFLAPGRALGIAGGGQPRGLGWLGVVVSQPELLLEACQEIFKPSSSFPRSVGFPIQIGVDVAMDLTPVAAPHLGEAPAKRSCACQGPWNHEISSRGKVTQLPLLGPGVSSFPFLWLLPC